MRYLARYGVNQDAAAIPAAIQVIYEYRRITATDACSSFVRLAPYLLIWFYIAYIGMMSFW